MSVNVAELNGPQWLKNGLQKLDTDGDGLEREEVEHMMTMMAEMKRAAQANSADLPYKNLPQNVQSIMKIWDGDDSGTVSVSELALAAESQKKMKAENRFLTQMLCMSVIVIILLTISSFATSYAAAEISKDVRPKEGSSNARLLLEYSDWDETTIIGQVGMMIESYIPFSQTNEQDETTIFGSMLHYSGIQKDQRKLSISKMFSDSHGNQPRVERMKSQMAALEKPHSVTKHVAARRLTAMTSAKGTPSEDDVNPGELALSDGTRAGVSQAVNTVKGYDAIMAAVAQMNDAELQQVLGFVFPTLQGPSGMPSVIDIKKDSYDNVNTIEFLGASGDVLIFQYTSNCQELANSAGLGISCIIEKEWFRCGISGLCEVILPPGGGLMRKLSPMSHGLHTSRRNLQSTNGTCASDTGICESTEFKMMIMADATDPSDVPIAPKIHKAQICADYEGAGCTESELKKVFTGQLGGAAAFDAAGGATSLSQMKTKFDCDGNGQISKKEDGMNGMCVGPAIEKSKKENPKKMMMKEKLDEKSGNAGGSLRRRNRRLSKNGMSRRHGRMLTHSETDWENYEPQRVIRRLNRETGELTVRRMAAHELEEQVDELLKGDPVMENVDLDIAMKIVSENPKVGSLIQDEEGNDVIMRKLSVADKDADGTLNEEEWEKVVTEIIPTSENLQNQKKAQSAQPGAKQKCPYFDVAFVKSPDDLKLSPLDTQTPSAKKVLFGKLDKNSDGKVTLEECTKNPIKEKKDTFEAACAAQTGECTDGLIDQEAYKMVKNKDGPGAGAATFEFAIKDTNNDGGLDFKEHQTHLADIFNDDSSAAGCTVRRLREEMIQKPRRRRMEIKFARKERRMRERMQRRLGTAGGYDMWLIKRQRRALKAVEKKERRLNQVRRQLKEENQEKLRKLEAWKRRRMQMISDNEKRMLLGYESADNALVAGGLGSSDSLVIQNDNTFTGKKRLRRLNPDDDLDMSPGRRLEMDTMVESIAADEAANVEMLKSDEDFAALSDTELAKMADMMPTGMKIDEEGIKDLKAVLNATTCATIPERILHEEADNDHFNDDPNYDPIFGYNHKHVMDHHLGRDHEENLESWENYGSRKVVGLIHDRFYLDERALAAHAGTPMTSQMTNADKKAMEAVFSMPLADLKAMKSTMEELVIDDTAKGVLDKTTGGQPTTPMLYANVDGASLCQLNTPVTRILRAKRFLMRRARILVSNEDSSVHGRRQLSEQDHADHLAMGVDPSKKRLLSDHNERRRLLTRVLAAKMGSMKDHCDDQVLSGGEIATALERAGKTPTETKAIAAKAKEEFKHAGAEQHARMRRVLAMKDDQNMPFELHEEDEFEIHRILSGHDNNNAGNMVDEGVHEVMTGCQVWEALSSTEPKRLMSRNPNAKHAYEAGDVNWCMFDKYEHSKYAKEEDNPTALGMQLQGQKQNADGTFTQKPSVDETMMMEEYLQDTILHLDAPKACVDLPMLEKDFPLLPDGTFNETDINIINTHSDEPGPGCIEECGCLQVDEATGMQNYVCSGAAGEAKLNGCKCMQNKRECHEQMMARFEEKAPELDESDNPAAGGGAAKRRMKAQMKIKKAKWLYERRIRRKSVRRLMPTDRSRILKEIRNEKLRRRQLRAIWKRDLKAIAMKSSDEARRLDLKNYVKTNVTKYMDDWKQSGFDLSHYNQDVCGDGLTEVCPCDPNLDDEACLGGIEMSTISQDEKQIPFEEVCPPCIDFAHIKEELHLYNIVGEQRRRLMAQASLDFNAQEEFKKLTEKEMGMRRILTQSKGRHLSAATPQNYVWDCTSASINLPHALTGTTCDSAQLAHAASVNAAFPENGAIQISLLTPVMKDKMQALLTENMHCVPDPENFRALMTMELHPPTIAEGVEMAKSGVIPATMDANAESKPSAPEVLQATLKENPAGDSEPVSTVTYEGLQTYKNDCEDPAKNTDADVCLTAENVQAVVTAAAGGGAGGGSIMQDPSALELAQEDIAAMGENHHFEMMKPDDKGFVQPGPYCCVRGMKDNVSRKDCVAEIMGKSKSVQGITKEEVYTKAPADLTQQVTNGMKGPQDLKKDAELQKAAINSTLDTVDMMKNQTSIADTIIAEDAAELTTATGQRLRQLMMMDDLESFDSDSYLGTRIRQLRNLVTGTRGANSIRKDHREAHRRLKEDLASDKANVRKLAAHGETAMQFYERRIRDAKLKKMHKHAFEGEHELIAHRRLSTMNDIIPNFEDSQRRFERIQTRFRRKQRKLIGDVETESGITTKDRREDAAPDLIMDVFNSTFGIEFAKLMEESIHGMHYHTEKAKDKIFKTMSNAIINYTDPIEMATYAALEEPHHLEDELNMLNHTLDYIVEMEKILKDAINDMEADITTAMNNGDYYEDHYKLPTENLEPGKAKKCALAVIDGQALIAPPMPQKTKLCMKDFIESAEAMPGAMQTGAVSAGEEWNAITQGQEVDESGCMPKKALEEMDAPMDPLSTPLDPTMDTVLSDVGHVEGTDGSGNGLIAEGIPTIGINRRKLTEESVAPRRLSLANALQNARGSTRRALKELGTGVGRLIDLKGRKLKAAKGEKSRKNWKIATDILIDWPKMRRQRRLNVDSPNTIGLVSGIDVPANGQVDSASEIHFVEKGTVMSNPADVKLLNTGCMPWEISPNEFKDQFMQTISESVDATRRAKASIAQAINVAGESGKTDKNALMTSSTQKQYVSGMSEFVDETNGECHPDVPCDPGKNINGVSDEHMETMFAKLDRDGDHCMMPDLGPTNSMDCHSFEESIFTMYEDDNHDGIPDGSVVQQFDYQSFCMEAKLRHDMEITIENFIKRAAEKKAMMEMQANTQFLENFRRNRVLGAVPFNQLYDTPARRMEATQMVIAERRLAQANKETGLEVEPPLTKSEIQNAVEDFVNPDGSTYPAGYELPSVNDITMLATMSGVDEQLKSDMKHMLHVYHDGRDMYLKQMMGKHGHNNHASVLKDMLLENTIDPKFSQDDRDELRHAVEVLASYREEYEDVWQKCRATVPLTQGMNTNDDSDADGIKDHIELATCAQLLVPEMPREFAEDLQAAANGELNLLEIVHEEVPEAKNATYAKEIREGLLDIDQDCYAECALAEVEAEAHAYVAYGAHASSRANAVINAGNKYDWSGDDWNGLAVGEGPCYVYIPEDCGMKQTDGSRLMYGVNGNNIVSQTGDKWVIGKWNLEEQSKPFGAIANQNCASWTQDQNQASLNLRRDNFYSLCYNTTSPDMTTTFASDLAWEMSIGFSGPRSSKCPEASCNFLWEHGNKVAMKEAEEMVGRARRALSINRRRRVLQQEEMRRRRLEGKDEMTASKSNTALNYSGNCVWMQGKEYCRDGGMEESERRLQQELRTRDLQARGVQYMVHGLPAKRRTQYSARISHRPDGSIASVSYKPRMARKHAKKRFLRRHSKRNV